MRCDFHYTTTLQCKHALMVGARQLASALRSEQAGRWQRGVAVAGQTKTGQGGGHRVATSTNHAVLPSTGGSNACTSRWACPGR